MLDWSLAGYKAGGVALPAAGDNRTLVNVRSYGAVGDNVTDDSTAFKSALAAVTAGQVLYIPAGTYRLSTRLNTSKSIIIRGDGSASTTLFFSKSLNDIDGNPAITTPQSQYAFGPGLIHISAGDPIKNASKVGLVTSSASRGTRQLSVSWVGTYTPKVGDWLVLTQNDVNQALINDMGHNEFDGGNELTNKTYFVRYPLQIVSISGAAITFNRAVPFNVSTDWSPQLHPFARTLSGAGVQGISVQFPWNLYPGHFKEVGWNGVFFEQVTNCFVDDVRVHNAESAVSVSRGHFCTINNVVLTSDAGRVTDPTNVWENFTGHHGLWAKAGSDVLIQNFKVNTRYHHDTTVEWYTIGAAMRNGSGVDLNMDYHKQCPYGALYTNTDLGAGSRPYASGGSDAALRGPNACPFSTSWFLQSSNPQGLVLPTSDFGAFMTFVGSAGKASGPLHPTWWVENVSPAAFTPRDLYASMRAAGISSVVNSVLPP